MLTSLKAFSHQRRAKPFNTLRSKADWFESRKAISGWIAISGGKAISGQIFISGKKVGTPEHRFFRQAH